MKKSSTDVSFLDIKDMKITELAYNLPNEWKS